MCSRSRDVIERRSAIAAHDVEGDDGGGEVEGVDQGVDHDDRERCDDAAQHHGQPAVAQVGLPAPLAPVSDARTAALAAAASSSASASQPIFSQLSSGASPCAG